MATVPEEKSKPAFDEQALDKLLEAAYVLQEHNRKSRQVAQQAEKTREHIESGDRTADQNNGARPHKATAQGDYTATLGRIVETQREIQVRHLDLLSAMALVAERVFDVCGGTGAAIAVVDGQFVHYRAVAGTSAPAADSTVPADKALCSPCVKAGHVFRCPDAGLEPELEKVDCARRGIQSLIAAPVFLEGNVTGALELYFAELHGFTEQDVHTCQLMAGLVTEALVREEEVTWKKSLASERAAMLEALEKLQPNLAALAQRPTDHAPVSSTTSGSPASCRQCGNGLLAGEQFCGECGAPQIESVKVLEKLAAAADATENSKGTHEKLDSVAVGSVGTATPSGFDLAGFEIPPENFIEEQLPMHASEASGHETLGENDLPDFAELLHAVEEGTTAEHADQTPSPKEEDSTSEPAAIEEKLTRPADWSSAAAAKDFLEQLAGKRGSGSIGQFWSTRRGDVYLAISVILVICVIVWGVMSSHSVDANGTQGPATAAHVKSSDPNLSFSDRLLIRLGLAEAPAPAEDKGNPAAQVWVDQRTGLYYCPGTDLYGKTPKGKFASQRDAQLDQFEPAYRKPCN